MLKSMFNFLKNKPKTWIDQPVIDYLMGLNPLFVIYYTAKVGNRNIKFKFRDENGTFLADVHQKKRGFDFSRIPRPIPSILLSSF